MRDKVTMEEVAAYIYMQLRRLSYNYPESRINRDKSLRRDIITKALESTSETFPECDKSFINESARYLSGRVSLD